MTLSEMAYVRTTPRSVEEAIARLGKELEARGYGILATLHVSRTIREKTGAEIAPMVILDVCSPKHARRALEVSREVGLLLPCKIVVSVEGGGTRIALQRPTVVMGQWKSLPELEPLGREVEEALRSAVDAAA